MDKQRKNRPLPPAGGPCREGPLPSLRRGLDRAARGTVYWLVLLILLFLVVNSLLFTSYFGPDYSETVYYKWDFWPLTLLWVGLFAALFWLLFRGAVWRRIPPGLLQGVLLVYVAALGVAWVLLVKGIPTFDSAFIVADAQAMAQNDWYPLGATAYTARHPYQLGMVLYIEVLVRLFGPQSLLPVQLLNVAWAVAVVHLLVSLTRLVSGSCRAVFAVQILLFGCLHPIFYTSFIYGQLPGLALALLGLWLVMRHLRGGTPWLLAGAVPAFALACVFKSNYLIFAVAAALALAVDFVCRLRPAALAGAAAVLLAGALAMQPVYALYQMRSGLAVGQGIPMNAYLAVGLQESPMAPGWFNDFHEATYFELQQDAAATHQRAAAEIKSRFGYFAAHPIDAARFFYLKAVSQWNEPTYEALLVNHHAPEVRHREPLSALGRSVFDGKLYALITSFMNGYHLLVLAGAAVFLVLRRRSVDMVSLLPGLVVLGGFLFHLFWEGKSQYIWPYFALLVPYCAAGVDAAAQRLQKEQPRD